MNQVSSRPILLGISFVQGLVLLWLYRAVESDAWPSQSPLWLYPLATLAFAIPVLLLLSLTRGNEHRVVRLTFVAAIVLLLTSLYTGSQARPYGEFPLASLTLAFVVSTTVACFKALMHLQQRASRQTLTYRVLFTNSWRNFLVTGLSALFACLFFLVLLLWGALFNLIGIDFFQDLFLEEWFLIPVLAVAFGLAVTIFRDLTRIIDGITRLLHGLIKLLLPLIVIVAVIFLLTLPFVGFDALWSTRRGTSLLLWLLAVMLFFTNAVYQDGRESDTYSPLVHRLIYWGLCAMPLVSMLGFYGLSTRISQYGWTVDRSWAVVVWALLSMIAVGYVIGIVRQRDEWTHSLARVNTVMGLVVLAVMLLANTPLLDFRKISLSSQLARVESGEIGLDEFDFWYARRNLVRPGYLAMERIKSEVGDSDPDLLAMIENPRPVGFFAPLERDENFWDLMVYRPGPFDVPDQVRSLINEIYTYRNEEPVLLRTDLDGDGSDEYVLIRRLYGVTLYYANGDEWKSAHMQYVSGEEPEDGFAEAPLSLVTQRFQDLQVGNYRVRALDTE